MKEEWKVYAEVVASQAKRWPDKCGHHRNLWCVSNLGNFKIMYNKTVPDYQYVCPRSSSLPLLLFGGYATVIIHNTVILPVQKL